jgi:hypothetical protein
MFFPDGTAILAPITAFAPALCAPPPGALGFSCTAHLTLGPGESEVFSMTLTMPAAPPAYWAENCFALSPTGLPAPALPPAPGAHSATTSCAWVPVGGPPPLSNLRLDKRALKGGQCYKPTPGDDIHCDYEIEIFNDGPSPFGGFITFTDVIPPAATITDFPPGWVCFPGPPATCGLAPPAIPAGGSIVAPITVSIPLAPLEAAGCAMPNTATIIAPAPGAPDNFFVGDDADTATASAFLEWWTPGGLIVTWIRPTSRPPRRPKAISSPLTAVSAASMWSPSPIWVPIPIRARSRSASSSASRRPRSNSHPSGATREAARSSS